MRRFDRIPQKQTICGKTWLVVCTKRRPPWARVDGLSEKDQLAVRDTETIQIWIKNTGNVEEMQEALMHEITHCLLDEVYRSSEMLSVMLDGNTAVDEMLTDFMSGQILSFIRDNDLTWARVRRNADPKPG